jgi:TonB dependent receptor/CarboxypepD_reg-like domain/TonB-dependent Receptor Plug Domain
VTAKKDESLTDVFLRIENTHAVRFFYQDDWLSGFTLKADFPNGTLDEFLTHVFNETDFSYRVLFGYAVVILRNSNQYIEYRENLTEASERKKIIESVMIGDRKNFVVGKKVTLKGTVRDLATKETQANITVSVNSRPIAVTDVNGQYTLPITAGDYLLTFRSVNFDEKVVDLHIYQNGELDVLLEEGSVMLDEVVVGGQNIVNTNVGRADLNLVDLKRSVALLGEVDIIRQVQNQPGVTNVGEIAGGFNVRGGGVDQNLVLYDDVPVFNTYHALGFFSSFNSESLSRISFYKGGIPAQFGGRISSVLSISSKSGDPKAWHGGGGIGMLSSYLFAGGPIKKDKTSLFVSMRGSYADWVLKTIQSNYRDLENSSLSFVDGSVRMDHKFNDKSSLSISGYSSYDEFSMATDTTFSYRNSLASAKYQYQFSNVFSGSLKFGYGRYRYQLHEPEPASAFKLYYNVTYPSVNLDFNYDGKHQVAFGVQGTWYNFEPGELTPASGESNVNPVSMQAERALESGVYVSDEIAISEKFLLMGGVRLSFYSRIGAGTVYEYEEGKPREVDNIVDSTQYASGEPMKNYYGIEPRFSLRYKVSDDASIKVGYNRIYQYLHLISNTAAVTPVDIWQSSNTYFKPQIGDQFSAGYYTNLSDHKYELSMEGFYKVVQNLLDFKDGANLILNKHLETALLAGKGNAYGAEFSFNKVTGRLQGSANYTYSRSLRTIDGVFSSEKINQGEAYASNYDQPHVFNFDWRYGISRRHFFSGNFTYHTGRPMSIPLSSYLVDGIPVMNFSERNKYRIPDYHRLDIAFVIEGNHKRKKIWSGTWVISLYNVYFRKNAYSVFYKADAEGNLRPYKLAVIGTMVPSVSYSFKF